jgi:hypothetical protein
MNRDILGMYLFENNIISVELAKVLKVYENRDCNIRSGYHMLENRGHITKPVI